MPKLAHETNSRARRWHQSGLEQITGCPRQWFLEHQLQVPTAVRLSAVSGIAYHSAVEAHELERLAGNPDGTDLEAMLIVAQSSVEEQCLDADPAELAKVSVQLPGRGKNKPEPLVGVDALVHQARTAVEAFWWTPEDGQSIRDRLMKMTPLGVEVFMTAPVVDGARDLAGTTDGIYWDPTTDEVVLVDHKTAARLGDWKKPGKGAAQAAHYAVLAMNDANLVDLDSRLPSSTLPRMDFLVVSRTLPARAGTERSVAATIIPNETDIYALGERVRTAEAHLSAGMFPANPAYMWCATCPFRDRCIGGTRELMAPVSVLLAEANRQG